MVNVLVFDKKSKGDLFKKYIKKCRSMKVSYTFDPDEAVNILIKTDPKIVLLGGDVADENLGCVKLFHMLEERCLVKGRTFYISTWNTDEARILRNMYKKAFYLPFCESLANIVKERARVINAKD